jgi:hypothetical protein
VIAVLEHLDHSSQDNTDDSGSGDAQVPLAYAYMRVPCNIPDKKVQRTELKLRAFAEGLGLRLAGIFREYACGAHGAFEDMLVELQRTGAHHVVIPTFGHLARNRLLQNSFLFRLEVDAGAEVFELVESD